MAAAPAFPIPRFLLPRSGLIWRQAVRASARLGEQQRPQQLLRYASTNSSSTGTSKSGSKGQHIVLEKPTKFNPPSHGSRLPNRKNAPASRHYGGDLSAAEVHSQKTRDYPGMPAPEGSWANWFFHSRALHLIITLGTLTGLAVFTFVENFRRTSPFADMMPALADFGAHPLLSAHQLVEVVRLTESHRSAEVAEKRKRRVDDVVRRSEYRKAHGLDQAQGLGGWTAKAEGESLGPALPAREGGVAPEMPASISHAEGVGEDGKRKKWLGIF